MTRSQIEPRSDGLSYPSDRLAAWRHIVRYLLALNSLGSFSFDGDLENVGKTFELFSKGEVEKEKLLEESGPIIAFFDEDQKRRFEWESGTVPYILVKILLSIPEAIDLGEVDVLIENYESILTRKCGAVNSGDLMRSYFWS